MNRDINKGTNGVPSKDGDMPQRNQERRSYADDGNDREMSDHRSPGSEHHRSTKSLRSPTNNSERVSTDDNPKKTRKHLPSQDITDASGDEEEGSRARENARKANSSRRKLKDFSADPELNKVHDDSLGLGEKSPSRSQQDGKDIHSKHDNQLSDSSEDGRGSGRKKRQFDSPDDSLVKQQSPSRAGMDETNNEHAIGSHGTVAEKNYLVKVDEASQSDGGSPLQKAKKSSNHIDYRSSGSEESEKHRSQSEKRRHKKSHKHKRHHDDSSESDSESDDKESKRRRREEKRLRKEERRLRRDERHRRRADRHASKQKMKYVGTPPSDLEKDREPGSDADARKKGSYTSREESDPKKLEVELRQRALESLSAKKLKHVVTPSPDEKDREPNSDADVRKEVSYTG